jgi:hypothetical protein
LTSKQLAKLSEELTFLESVWVLVNMRYDGRAGHQAPEVELEFILQMFKILFDPYSSVDQQVRLLEELRRIIRVIYESQPTQIRDQFLVLYPSLSHQQAQLRLLISRFR